MPAKIRVLDDHTINKIAAGEVIENPASVVKELVENSIDAGATEITVEIQTGGRQLIRVSDNGEGMGKDDALLAFERHATSKIRDVEEIFSITSMGFRGEAVPSIASISKTALLTNDGKETTFVETLGGKIIKCSLGTRDRGTTFEVRDLFFNVPVRKKFQRSPTYDTSEIIKIVTLQALAHPDIKFQLISEKAKELFCPVSKENRLKERIEALFGHEWTKSLLNVDTSLNNYTLKGYIGLPSEHRPNRQGQYLFVNGRPVFSPLISYLIKESYATTLPQNRHPIFVLYLEMPGHLVDVNVHPQKREVRLRQQEELKTLLFQAVDQALSAHGVNFIQEVSIEPAQFSPPPLQTSEQSFIYKAPSPPPLHYEPLPIKKSTPKIVYTMQNYILLENHEGGITLVDQRKALSRIVYENFLKEKRFLESEQLLIPYPIELDPEQIRLIQEHQKSLEKMGFELGEFGQKSFVIRSMPVLFSKKEPQKVVESLLNTLQKSQNPHMMQEEQEKWIAASLSSSQFPEGKTLSLYEAKDLIERLYSTSQPTLCPKGKPTVATWNKQQIEKFFHSGIKESPHS